MIVLILLLVFFYQNLIDLAGSESSKTETTGLRRKEGSYINKSLLTLGTVGVLTIYTVFIAKFVIDILFGPGIINRSLQFVSMQFFFFLLYFGQALI